MGKYKDLQNKRTVITGGASGIGLATAQRFAEEGARVVIFDWNKVQLEDVLSKNPVFSGGVHMDVSQQKEVEDAFQKTDEILGGIDILIANAGISFQSPFLDMDYAQWSKVLRVNLDGAFLCSKEAITRMKPRRQGVVLFTASTNGLEGHPLYADYNASKAGVILLTKTLALEFAPWLRANALCPGYVLTPMQKSEYTEEELKKMDEDIPLQRQASPEEVAALFAFLASDDAAFITGQAIAIDGGETSGIFLKELIQERKDG
jgi:NAD(P)-dependent dehydrogenase (short-subunit alcohol dehydrogenase family)